MSRYTFLVHNIPQPIARSLSLARAVETPQPTVRRALVSDVRAIWELVGTFAANGSMLARSRSEIASKIDSYVVAVGPDGNVLACAALEEFSPSLGEVASVAVARSEHGKGLGTEVVLGVERLARARDIEELFAMSLTDNFFLSMGYETTTVARYPEKLARYEKMKSAGIEVVPKRCFRKRLDASWAAPELVVAELKRRIAS
jgi:amino-acid N-acetyltransferase